MAAPAKSATCASGFLIVADDPDDPTGMMRKTLKSELNTESSAERFAQSEFSNVYAKCNVRYVVMADVQIDTKRALNKHTIVVNVRVLDSVNGAERFKNSYTQEKTTPALDAFRANALKDIAKQASLSILSIT